MGLFSKLVRSFRGKEQITPSELGHLIANQVLGELGHSQSPFLFIDPLVKRILDPEAQKRLVIEKTAAYTTFFTHLFWKSCNSSEFGRQTCLNYTAVIVVRTCEDKGFQEVFGFANGVDADRLTFEAFQGAFYKSADFYLGVLKTCPDDDCTNFVRTHQSALGIPYRENSKAFWVSLSSHYRGQISRLWEVFTPGSL